MNTNILSAHTSVSTMRLRSTNDGTVLDHRSVADCSHIAHASCALSAARINVDRRSVEKLYEGKRSRTASRIIQCLMHVSHAMFAHWPKQSEAPCCAKTDKSTLVVFLCLYLQCLKGNEYDVFRGSDDGNRRRKQVRTHTQFNFKSFGAPYSVARHSLSFKS